jgi:RimJ/RimL family protein N-acetyltransferase
VVTPPSTPSVASRFETQTLRLTLRRPRDADRGFQHALHEDPRGYVHAPHARRNRADNEAFLDAVQRHWDDHGFGYWTVVETASAKPVGMAGLRHSEDFLNLYYRIAAEAHGRGYAREVAREAVALGTEWLPDLPVQALVKEHNTASVRTALSAGLVRAGSKVLGDDRPGEPASVVFEAPDVERHDALDDSLRQEVVDLWCRVNDAGGAVGFLPGAPRQRVAAALAGHEEQMARGLAFAGTLRAPDAALLGLAWWVRSTNPLLSHGLSAYRVMTDPDHRGRNLGRILMSGLHRLARDDGAELVTLDYRSGTGVGGFYARCGYTEVGRVPGTIRVAPGDERDSVIMARRLDGLRLRADGRG